MYTSIGSPIVAGSAFSQAKGLPLVGSMQFNGGLHDFLKNIPGYFQDLFDHSASDEAVPGSTKKDDSNSNDGMSSDLIDLLKELWNTPISELDHPEFLKNIVTGNHTENILAFLKYFGDPDSFDVSDPSGSPRKSSENSASTVNQDGSISGLDSSTLNYLNAELAKVYGMDRTTAYQEALSNTAYQRAVRDMKNAGLNPAVLFGGGRGSSASGVSFIGRNTGSGSGSGEEENFFSDGVFNGIPVLVGLVASIVGRNPKYFPIAEQTAKAIMGLVDDFSKLK